MNESWRHATPIAPVQLQQILKEVRHAAGWLWSTLRRPQRMGSDWRAVYATIASRIPLIASTPLSSTTIFMQHSLGASEALDTSHPAAIAILPMVTT
ncbi:MAG: hypothetical protein JSS49_18125 [Planctomycetes bacterium]|nr:hypothetical protein [Planctomycetota bacterium]